MSYASLAELREYLNQVESGSAQDSVLQKILDRSDSLINGALGFSFAAYGVSTSTKRVLATSGQYLRIPPYSYTTIASIYPMSGASVGTVAITDYEELQSMYRLYRSVGWGGQRYQITAIWGYGAAPESIKELALELSVNIWRSKDRGMWTETVGASQVGNNVGGGAVITYTGGLTNQQKAIIKNVRYAYHGMGI